MLQMKEAGDLPAPFHSSIGKRLLSDVGEHFRNMEGHHAIDSLIRYDDGLVFSINCNTARVAQHSTRTTYRPSRRYVAVVINAPDTDVIFLLIASARPYCGENHAARRV